MSDTSAQSLPRYRRSDNPPPMKLTERDKHILEAVHAYDGMLADYQIQALFFTGRTQMKLRTKLLFQNGYLNRPDRKRRAALDYMIYWLGKKGAEYVAGLAGQTLEDFEWRREPRWGQISHDIAVNDFRIAVVQACQISPHLVLGEWIPEGEFRSNPDSVKVPDQNGKSTVRKVQPDGYFVIETWKKRLRWLLEIDMRTEDNPRFVREKVIPGLTYVKSDAYKERFGYNAGNFLVVTTGERRMRYMKRHAEDAVGDAAKFFFFTTFSQVSAQTVLTAPIWLQGGYEEPVALFDNQPPQ